MCVVSKDRLQRNVSVHARFVIHSSLAFVISEGSGEILEHSDALDVIKLGCVLLERYILVEVVGDDEAVALVEL